MERVDLAGIVVDLLDEKSAVEKIMERATGSPGADGHTPLSVVSANLDHIAQFGNGSRWAGTLGDSLRPTISPMTPIGARGGPATMEWLTLLDGAPLVAQSNKLTGKSWPRLAGSDLIGPLLDESEKAGMRVGFLGGAPHIQDKLTTALETHRPNLVVSGRWAPERSVLADPAQSRALAAGVFDSETDLLVVGLGKPRQELWMAEYGALTGAKILLAFGAVVDFLAGAVQRAPRWAADHGVEWAWRLALEPKRLARRYLVDDPPALVEMRRNSRLIPQGTEPATPVPIPMSLVHEKGDGGFVSSDVDVAVLIVTYNSASSLPGLIESLRDEARELRIKVVVADNDSSDKTLDAASAPDVTAFSTGGNLGYAAGINAARRTAGPARAYLVLNPDMRVEPGSVKALYQRLTNSPAGIVVPKLVNEDGTTLHSLRREPSLTRALGDATLGERKPGRPTWLCETEHLGEAYQHAHRVDWATGAALMISRETSDLLGDWDERFFLYSEETDYFRRARDAGIEAWYQPSSTMVHTGGGSGSSPDQDALLAVNKVRYVRKHRPRGYAGAFRIISLLGEAVRPHNPGRRAAARFIADEASWDRLPGPQPARTTPPEQGTSSGPLGTIIIPAHNESAVIARTLTPLLPLVSSGTVEVIVAVNGCTDDTAQIVRDLGVTVLDLPEPSKTAALNSADSVAKHWPRLYLDADITITPVAVTQVLESLSRRDVLAARPAFRYDTTGTSLLVRSFYRARRRIPATTTSLWGAGAYALSKEGHDRFGTFPTVTADDLFVDQQFSRSEIALVATPPVKVVTPRTLEGLQAILSRTYRGQSQLSNNPTDAPSTSQTARQLLATVRGPSSLVDAGIYAALVVQGRLTARNSTRSWERDDSSRQTATSSPKAAA